MRLPHILLIEKASDRRFSKNLHSVAHIQYQGSISSSRELECNSIVGRLDYLCCYTVASEGMKTDYSLPMQL